jgi:hypothetical protein
VGKEGGRVDEPKAGLTEDAVREERGEVAGQVSLDLRGDALCLGGCVGFARGGHRKGGGSRPQRRDSTHREAIGRTALR